MKLKVSFTNTIQQEVLEEVAILQRWTEVIENKNFSPLKGESESNSKLITNPVSKVDYAIRFFAKKLGEVICHEISSTKKKSLSENDYQLLKVSVANALTENFELHKEEII